MSVTINIFEYLPAHLYDYADNPVGIIKSPEQLNDVRIQIKTQGLTGYYMLWTDKEGLEHHIKIDISGNLERWWPGFFDITDHQLERLLGW